MEENKYTLKYKKCSICNIVLDMSELKINEQYKKMYKTTNIQYCKDHNPFNCEICNKLKKYMVKNMKTYLILLMMVSYQLKTQ